MEVRRWTLILLEKQRVLKIKACGMKTFDPARVLPQTTTGFFGHKPLFPSAQTGEGVLRSTSSPSLCAEHTLGMASAREWELIIIFGKIYKFLTLPRRCIRTAYNLNFVDNPGVVSPVTWSFLRFPPCKGPARRFHHRESLLVRHNL